MKLELNEARRKWLVLALLLGMALCVRHLRAEREEAARHPAPVGQGR